MISITAVQEQARCKRLSDNRKPEGMSLIKKGVNRDRRSHAGSISFSDLRDSKMLCEN